MGKKDEPEYEQKQKSLTEFEMNSIAMLKGKKKLTQLFFEHCSLRWSGDFNIQAGLWATDLGKK